MIKPPTAISIWTCDDKLFAELPSFAGCQAHTITLPATPEGLTQLLKLLNNRNAQSRLGEAGDPTQHHVDKGMTTLAACQKPFAYDETKVRRFGKPRFSQELKASASDVLRRLGMI